LRKFPAGHAAHAFEDTYSFAAHSFTLHALAGPSTEPAVGGSYLAIHAVAPWNMLVALAPPAPVHDVVIVKPLLKAAALLNMELKFATALTTHELMSWLKFVALWNMPLMSVTADVTHELMSWVNAAAPLNMLFMFNTDDVTHVLRSWLNAAAPLNMLLMSVTAVVSHEPMFALNVVEPWNKPAMSSTLLTTQLAIATPLPSVHVAPVASPPRPRQYEDAMVFASSAFEANGDAYVHAVSDPV